MTSYLELEKKYQAQSKALHKDGVDPPPLGSLGHLEWLIEPMEVLRWTLARFEEPRARRPHESERLRLRRFRGG